MSRDPEAIGMSDTANGPTKERMAEMPSRADALTMIRAIYRQRNHEQRVAQLLTELEPIYTYVALLITAKDAAERQLAEIGAQMEAIQAIVEGREPSDFLLSFPLVRAVDDLRRQLAEQGQELARVQVALTDMLAANRDPNAVTGEFDAAAGRARRLLKGPTHG